jgi:hypothetical protein
MGIRGVPSPSLLGEEATGLGGCVSDFDDAAIGAEGEPLPRSSAATLVLGSPKVDCW